MNLLILKDFFWIFLNFSEFKIDLFELNSLYIYRVLTWQVMWHRQKARHHVAAYEHVMWQRVGVHACVYVCACVHVCGKREISFLFRITLSLSCSLTLYTRTFSWFLSCETLFCFKHAQVMWQHKERQINTINEDHSSSLTTGGTRYNSIRWWIIFKMI